MCKCDPRSRTPFCGKPGCEWPEQENPINIVKSKYINPKASLQLLEVCKLAYRKHAWGDDCVGWDELSDKLKDALCEAMGDLEFLEWVGEQYKKNKPSHTEPDFF